MKTSVKALLSAAQTTLSELFYQISFFSDSETRTHPFEKISEYITFLEILHQWKKEISDPQALKIQTTFLEMMEHIKKDMETLNLANLQEQHNVLAYHFSQWAKTLVSMLSEETTSQFPNEEKIGYLTLIKTLLQHCKRLYPLTENIIHQHISTAEKDPEIDMFAWDPRRDIAGISNPAQIRDAHFMELETTLELNLQLLLSEKENDGLAANRLFKIIDDNLKKLDFAIKTLPSESPLLKKITQKYAIFLLVANALKTNFFAKEITSSFLSPQKKGAIFDSVKTLFLSDNHFHLTQLLDSLTGKPVLITSEITNLKSCYQLSLLQAIHSLAEITSGRNKSSDSPPKEKFLIKKVKLYKIMLDKFNKAQHFFILDTEATQKEKDLMQAVLQTIMFKISDLRNLSKKINKLNETDPQKKYLKKLIKGLEKKARWLEEHSLSFEEKFTPYTRETPSKVSVSICAGTTFNHGRVKKPLSPVERSFSSPPTITAPISAH